MGGLKEAQLKTRTSELRMLFTSLLYAMLDMGLINQQILSFCDHFLDRQHESGLLLILILDSHPSTQPPSN